MRSMEPLRRKCKMQKPSFKSKIKMLFGPASNWHVSNQPRHYHRKKKINKIVGNRFVAVFFAFTIFITLFVFHSCPEPSSCWSQCTVSPPPINLSHPFLLSSPSHLPFAPCSGCCKGFTLLIFPKQTRRWLKAATRDAEHELCRPRGPAGEVITPLAPQEVTHPGLKWEPLSEYSPKL